MGPCLLVEDGEHVISVMLRNSHVIGSPMRVLCQAVEDHVHMPYRSYEFNVASLGLTNVPGYFGFAVGNNFAELRKIINSFFDDFIGHSKGIRTAH